MTMARTLSPPRTSRRSPPAQRHPSSSTPTTVTSTNTSTTSNRSPALQRAAERPNIPIAPASSNTSSPIYSTTSSPPISPGIPQYPTSSLGTMAPRSDPRSSALTMEMPPTSTPTGRISKAKKGKRVHACEFPGCGKVFTRAEHKRRHELNHNPDATYRCQQQGCGKSFHRLDLLQRHQERHEGEGASQMPSPRRYPSHTAVLSEPPTALPTTSIASPPIPAPPSRPSAGGGMSIPSIMNQTFHAGTDPTASFVGMGPYMQLFSSAESWEPIYVPETIHSPHPRHFHRSNGSATPSVVSYDHTGGSPMIPASMPQAAWSTTAPPTTMPDMFDPSGMSPYAPSATVNCPRSSFSHLDGVEWDLIRRELSNVSGVLSSPHRSAVPESMRWHCWELYWQCFHPTYPIVHRPSHLEGNKTPPLLALVMVAIGSYYDTREDAKQYSLRLLELATTILRRRQSNTNSSSNKNPKARAADLQTVVLLEILSTFCARQISVRMSNRFRTLYASINQSTAIQPAQPLAVFRTLESNHSAADLEKARGFWLEVETRNRILHACLILDSQQTVLFDQEPTVRKPRVTAATKPINLPCDDNLWDATSPEQWARIAEKHEYVQMVGGKPSITPGRQAEHSYFQRQVINANGEGNLRASQPKQSVTVTSDPMMAKSEFDYHAIRMCKNTPIRKLLTVVGESWLLGQKIEKRAEFERAQKDLRKWLEDTPNTKTFRPDCSAAHWHALKLLRILYVEAGKRSDRVEIFGTTNMLHENWIVYLACLICWAQGQRKALRGVPAYNPQHDPGSSGLVSAPDETAPITDGMAKPGAMPTTSCLDDPSRAADEAEAYLIFTDVATEAALRDLEPAILGRTQGLLESVRSQKIVKHMMGGLMNDADQVLRKLVEGDRNIVSMFDAKA